MLINFTLLQPGDRVKILGFNPCEPSYRQHLLAMGLTRGTEFTVVRKAPFGDPVAIKVRGFVLTLRKHEALTLQLEKLSHG